MTEPLLVYSTHPTLEQARQTAEYLLREKLAACCNILPAAESHYMWQGERQSAVELVMFSKTTDILADSVIEAICRLHPYACPAVLKLPISGGNTSFIQWIAESTQSR